MYTRRNTVKKFTKRNFTSMALVAMLTLALSVTTAFAAWPSFQNTNTNNGVITVPTGGTAPPISPSTTARSVQLPTNNPAPDYPVYTGVDTTCVIDDNGIAYTLYNGGVTNGTAGGARLQATNLSTGATVWNTQLDAGAGNDNQLSTPYLKDNSLFAAVSRSTAIFATNSSTGVSGWNTSYGVTINSSGVATIPADGGIISKQITLTQPVNYLYLPTNINGTDGNYTVMLGSKRLARGSVTSSGYGTFDNYNGAQIDAGTYLLSIGVANNTAEATVSLISLIRYDWSLYSVTNLGGAPSKTRLVGSSSINPNYEGQVNTPISYDGNGNIYWGVYGGTHSYYRLNITSSGQTPVPFKPTVSGAVSGFDDFYGSGAALVTINNADYMVFGSDSGNVYVRPADNTFATAAGNSFTPSGAGKIRSSMALSGDYAYYTAQNGKLYRTTVSELLNAAPTTASVNIPSTTAIQNTTSTPVVSANGYVYVGWYGYDASFVGVGGVVAVPTSFTASTTPTTVYSGDAVQASPIVYSVTTTTPTPANRADYVYFTTNADHSGDSPPVTNHNGYCYRVGLANLNVPVPTLAWNPSSGGTYALQGFAADNGHLVYGDDSNTLYIF
jgi:outer membrane protein assembly factor BamB